MIILLISLPWLPLCFPSIILTFSKKKSKQKNACKSGELKPGWYLKNSYPMSALCLENLLMAPHCPHNMVQIVILLYNPFQKLVLDVPNDGNYPFLINYPSLIPLIHWFFSTLGTSYPPPAMALFIYAIHSDYASLILFYSFIVALNFPLWHLLTMLFFFLSKSNFLAIHPNSLNRS